ncbi:MAG: protocatechuate 3,4-dioxygenase subunit alpha [Candidatus Acidiferrales bacterium]
MWPGAARGEHIMLVIRVLDGEEMGVPDALVELWQADADGKYNHPDDLQHRLFDPAFYEFGRLATDQNGEMMFECMRPARVRGIDGVLQAPYISVHTFCRGTPRHVSTQVYFANDLANAEDPILKLVPSNRGSTLLASANPREQGAWRINLHLCGEGETAFF